MITTSNFGILGNQIIGNFEVNLINRIDLISGSNTIKHIVIFLYVRL